MVIEKSQKVAKKYHCECCDYSCYRKNDFDKHLSTRKHKMVINGNKMVIENLQNPLNDFKCICGKSYKHNSSYSRHKKTCTFINEEENNNNGGNCGGNNEKLVEKLLEDNAEMRGLIKEIIHKIGNTKKVIKNIAKEVIVDKENE